MTRRQIVLTIDCEDEKCIGCEYIGLSGSQWWCRLHHDYCGFYGGNSKRCEPCLAAERKLARLIDEGEYMRKDYYHKDEPCGWDAAMEEVRK